MTQAVSFERLYLTDRMTRVLFAELLASTSVVAVLMASINYLSPEGALLIGLIVAVILLNWGRWEVARRSRKLVLAVIIRTFFTLRLESKPAVPPFGSGSNSHTSSSRGYLVEAKTKDTVIRYTDHEPRSEGERIFMILDGKGRVLATSKIGNGVKLDLLLRLR
ncbi:MAG: hypothetical protein NZ988_04020 [Thaumarchaeota archaeon]|nr:hypothetical protein [Candidatus Calditenuaceae archaeon]MDW8187196.1 hypothetical protein [Nitrososphaerota archaeon]